MRIATLAALHWWHSGRTNSIWKWKVSLILHVGRNLIVKDMFSGGNASTKKSFDEGIIDTDELWITAVLHWFEDNGYCQSLGAP